MIRYLVRVGSTQDELHAAKGRAKARIALAWDQTAAWRSPLSFRAFHSAHSWRMRRIQTLKTS